MQEREWLEIKNITDKFAIIDTKIDKNDKNKGTTNNRIRGENKWTHSRKNMIK